MTFDYTRLQSFKGSDRDNDHYQVVAKVDKS